MTESISVDGLMCGLVSANVGQNGLDLAPLLKQKDAFSYDPGFMSTASCTSKITYIDGDAGILMHRGYLIQDIVAKKSFIDVAYLILNGNFPNKDETMQFQNDLSSVKIETEALEKIVNCMDKNIHPMTMCMTLLSYLAGSREEDFKTKNNYEKCLEVIQYTLYIISLAGCKLTGREFKPVPVNDHYTKSFLSMFLGEGMSNNALVVEILDKILILHIDHEQNASTSSVRMISSTQCDIYGSIVAGFAALWGPLHGGANEAVLEMLGEIGSVDNVQIFIDKVKKKETKLMGFGHRVYKNYDPRGGILKGYCSALNSTLHFLKDNTKFQVALELEKIALSDEYFISRKLFPNLDFYSGIIYEALGIDTKMFTCMFALGRVVGWCAQWLEATNDNGKIWRPRQVYSGEKQRSID